MKIHEYQAKELFIEYGLPADRGPVYTEKAESYDFTGVEFPAVVKAQVHSGGRGKAGGVKFVKDAEEATKVMNELFGKTLYTVQVPQGKVVRRILLAPAVAQARELYLSLTLDAAHECIDVIASGEGGTEIEELLKNNPSAIITKNIPYEIGVQTYHAIEIAKAIKLNPNNYDQFASILKNMYRMMIEKDCSLVEINPLNEYEDKLLILDAKVNFDDNALFRHPDIKALRDEGEEDPKELEASKYDLNFVSLEGNIGCLVNGAGLAMATMDTIKSFGGEPANFLDVGGSATTEKVTAAFRILMADKNVKAILVNIFGGIMKCDVIAQGIVEATKSVGLNIPLIVRLDGTNVELGKEIISKSGLNIIPADGMRDAVRKAVESLGGTK